MLLQDGGNASTAGGFLFGQELAMVHRVRREGQREDSLESVWGDKSDHSKCVVDYQPLSRTN